MTRFQNGRWTFANIQLTLLFLILLACLCFKWGLHWIARLGTRLAYWKSSHFVLSGNSIDTITSSCLQNNFTDVLHTDDLLRSRKHTCWFLTLYRSMTFNTFRFNLRCPWMSEVINIGILLYLRNRQELSQTVQRIPEATQSQTDRRRNDLHLSCTIFPGIPYASGKIKMQRYWHNGLIPWKTIKVVTM